MGQALRNGSHGLKLWTVEKLVPGGAGLCRLPDGAVGFVEGAFPGETLKPLATVEKKDYVRATRFELVEASRERVPAPCPVVDTCGGCDWMKLERTAELRHKASLVVEALERTGGVRLSSTPEMITAGGELGYRSRVRLHVDARGRVGFYARGTHTLVEVPGCPVAEPEVERGIRVVRALAERSPRAMALFESVEVRSRDEGGLEFIVHERREPPRRSKRAETRRDEASVIDGLSEHGVATLSRTSAEFSQVNRAVNAALVSRVVERARARGVATFLDLYAGSGNFAVPLARAGATGVLVESDAASVEQAQRRAEREAPGRLRALCRDVASALDALALARERFDLVLLDPPRTGAKDALSGIAPLEPGVIGYVACDPVTLARDVRALGGHGWSVAEVTCFDMFPQTHHVETLAWLERR